MTEQKKKEYHVIARFWGRAGWADAHIGTASTASEARALRDQWTESGPAHDGRRVRCATPASCGVWLVPPLGSAILGAAVYAVTAAPWEEHAAELDALERSALRVL